jgi:hypothetical protein
MLKNLKRQGPTLQLLALHTAVAGRTKSCISPMESFSDGFNIQSAGLHEISIPYTSVCFQLMPSAEQVIFLFLDWNTSSGVSEEFCSISYKAARTTATLGLP